MIPSIARNILQIWPDGGKANSWEHRAKKRIKQKNKGDQYEKN